jgi:hypothetical protein
MAFVREEEPNVMYKVPPGLYAIRAFIGVCHLPVEQAASFLQPLAAACGSFLCDLQSTETAQ